MDPSRTVRKSLFPPWDLSLYRKRDDWFKDTPRPSSQEEKQENALAYRLSSQMSRGSCQKSRRLSQRRSERVPLKPKDSLPSWGRGDHQRLWRVGLLLWLPQPPILLFQDSKGGRAAFPAISTVPPHQRKEVIAYGEGLRRSIRGS